MIYFQYVNFFLVENGKFFIVRTMKGNRFVNPHCKELRRTIFDVILWKIGHYDDIRSRIAPPPSGFIYPAIPPSYNRTLPSAMWIGHSTYLIEIGGLTLLTDPVWDSHCAPFRFKIFKRINEPSVAITDLPPIDFVLQSHNHYDHLDAKAVAHLQKLNPKLEWIVPLGLSNWFRRRGIETVTELGWWEERRTQKWKVTAVPAQHFSGRTLWDKNKTHWNGYVLESEGKRLYFTGDTGYNCKDFKSIGEHWPWIDLSLIPIGTYSPQKFMQPVHVSPYEAVQIHQDVKSNFSLGMHWNTFRLSEEPLDLPPYDLYLAMKEKGLPFESFLPIDIGTYVNW